MPLSSSVTSVARIRCLFVSPKTPLTVLYFRSQGFALIPLWFGKHVFGRCVCMPYFSMRSAPHWLFNSATRTGRRFQRVRVPSSHSAAVAVVKTDGAPFHVRVLLPAIYLTNWMHKVFTFFRKNSHAAKQAGPAAFLAPAPHDLRIVFVRFKP